MQTGPLKTNTSIHEHSIERFVDDIFMLWTESEAKWKALFEQINKIHSTIKFDYKYSYESIEFLDILVFKNNRNSLSLSTKLYSKPTDRPTYTHVTSYHSKSQIQNIPYEQALRVKRICAVEEDFKAQKRFSNKRIQRINTGRAFRQSKQYRSQTTSDIQWEKRRQQNQVHH